MFILRFLNWCLCFALRCTAHVCGRAHQRLKSGPQARLWAASDHELMAEAKKRGLLRRSKGASIAQMPQYRTAGDINIPMEKRMECTNLAVLSVCKLQNVSERVAEKAVLQALAEIPGPKRNEVQEIVKLAIKKCA